MRAGWRSGSLLAAAGVAAALVLSACPGLRTRNSPEFIHEQPGVPDPAQANYEIAVGLFYEKRYDRARQAFLKVLENTPRSRYAADAFFKIAECFFHMEDYPNAAVYFRRYLDRFPDGSLAVDARMRLRQCTAKGATGYGPFLDAGLRRERLLAVMVPILAGRDFAEVDEEIQHLAEAGFDTLILRVFQDRGQPFHGPVPQGAPPEGVYFRTTRAPVVEDLVGDVAEICRQHGMKLFAWMNTRGADYGLEGKPYLHTHRYDFDAGLVVPGRGLNLFHDEAVRHLVGLFRDLAAENIDGILLHDDLLLRADEDLSPEAVAAFQRRFHRRLVPMHLFAGFSSPADLDSRPGDAGEDFHDWARLKAERIVEIQSLLAAEAKQSRPTIRFGVSFLHVVLTDLRYAPARVGQDLMLSREAGFDYYAVTAYQRQLARDLALDPERAGDAVLDLVERARTLVGNPDRVLVKLQLVDWAEEALVPPGELARLLTRLADRSPPSVALFPYRPDFPFRELEDQIARLKQTTESGTRYEEDDEPVEN